MAHHRSVSQNQHPTLDIGASGGPVSCRCNAGFCSARAVSMARRASAISDRPGRAEAMRSGPGRQAAVIGM